MPLYYFDIHNGDMTEDYEGRELADDKAAHAYAIVGARSLAAETVAKGHFAGHHRIEIKNERREHVCSVRFDEAVDIRP